MAVKQVEVLVDDLTGEEGTDIGPVYFIHDGELYRMDLTAENRQRLLDATAEFAAKGHSLGEFSPDASPVEEASPAPFPGYQEEAPKLKEKVQPGTYDPEHVRAWAKGAGIEVNPRGRIANTVLEVFFLLHADYVREMDLPPAMWERTGEVDAEHFKELGISWDEYPAYVEFNKPGGRDDAFAGGAPLPVAKKTQQMARKKKQLVYPPYDPENVRAWAEGAGIEVNPRGRIAKKVLDAFFREHDLNNDFKELMPKLWEMRGREHADFLESMGLDWEARSQFRSVELGY